MCMFGMNEGLYRREQPSHPLYKLFLVIKVTMRVRQITAICYHFEKQAEKPKPCSERVL